MIERLVREADEVPRVVRHVRTVGARKTVRVRQSVLHDRVRDFVRRPADGRRGSRKVRNLDVRDDRTCFVRGRERVVIAHDRIPVRRRLRPEVIGGVLRKARDGK